MLSIIITLALLFQSGPTLRPTIVAKKSEPPRRNFHIVYYDDLYLFAARHYGDSRDFGGNTEPGLFVHSKKHNKWIQIFQISTAGAKLGKSSSDDPEVQKKMRFASVGWDFTRFAKEPYIDQPLRTSGSVSFPERVTYDASEGKYELGYFLSWGVPSVATILYVDRKDILAAFERVE